MSGLLILLHIVALSMATSNRTLMKSAGTRHFSHFRQGHQGRTDEDKIVGGRFLESISHVPFQVSMMVKGQNECGGCLLTLDFVLTACHCVANIPRYTSGRARLRTDTPWAAYKFVAGTANLKHFDKTAQVGAVKTIHIHPRCGNKKQIVYDLALVKMKTPFDQTPYVKPVKMYTWDKKKFQDHLLHIILYKRKPVCTVGGWGETRRGKFSDTTVSDQLKVVRMFPLRDRVCRNIWADMYPRYYKNFNFWQHGQICVVNEMLDSSDCRGDSGSPYVCQKEYLVAVVSYGAPGCSVDDPSVYQTVAELIPWVKKDFANDINTTEPRKVLMHREKINSEQPPPQSKGTKSEANPHKPNLCLPLLLRLLLLVTLKII